MKIIHADFKKGDVKLRIEDLEDLWYLSHIIDIGDFVKGKTTRKIKIGQGDNIKTVKKTITLSIEVERVEFHKYGDSLRVNGLVREGPEDIPNGSYHTISLESGSEFKLRKVTWLNYQKQKLEEATEKKYNFLICIFDREEALFYLSKNQGQELLLRMDGEVAKKRKGVEVKKDFYGGVIKTLIEYNSRYNPDSLVLASPAFFKDDLMKHMNDKELKKKIVLATCGSVSSNALEEVMKSSELQDALTKSRTRTEELLVDELLAEIKKEGLVAYGFDEVEKAVHAGAVSKLMVVDTLIHQTREDGTYEKLDMLMKSVDNLKGEISIISEEHQGGKKLKGLGSIGAILRYKLEW